jgi:uncharacterized protein (DUF305 family)
MRLRWLGVTGTALLLTSLVLMLAGPRLWPTAFFGARVGAMSSGMMDGQNGMMSGGMMGGSSGMMSGGMMDGQGGMMSGGMMGMMSGGMAGMMSSEVGGDLSQPFELRFLDQMVPHHQMAVHSAQMMIANSERPELRDLAQRIISAQQAEIDQMGLWRAAWFPDAAAPTLMMGGQGGMMGGQGSMMGGSGGMMSDQAQMDRLFLEMMIPHHEAAISMARQALEESERPEIRTLAEAIISSQTAEIDEMRGYLRDFFGVTTP